MSSRTSSKPRTSSRTPPLIIQVPPYNIPPQPNNRPPSTSNRGSLNNRGSSTSHKSPTNNHKTPGSPFSNLSGKNAFNRFFPHGTNGVQRPFPNHHVNQPEFSHHPHRSYKNPENETDYEELFYVPKKHPKSQNSRTQLEDYGNSAPFCGNVGPFAYNSPSYIYEGGRSRHSVGTVDDYQHLFGNASLSVSYYFGWILVLAKFSVLLFLGFIYESI